MPGVRFFNDALGRRIAYAVHGSGPPLVCPCWWVSHLDDDWAHPPFRRFFETLGSALSVVRYDRPGVGLSDRDAPNRSLAEELALFESLMDELGLEQATLFGASCGGPLALAYAARHPERVSRLAFWGSYLSGGDLTTPELGKAMIDLVRAHWGVGSRALADVFLPGASSEEAVRFSERQRRAASGETAAHLLELTYAFDATDSAPRVRAPALVLHRRAERAVPFEAGRRLAAAVAGAEFVALEGRAHEPWEGSASDLEPLLAFLGQPQPSVTRAASGERAARPWSLDFGARALLVDGEATPLTRLEWGVVSYLAQQPGQVVTRDELLREVWGQPFGGSNVVDAVIRSLRKKLASHAVAIETVTGHGYRLRP